MSEVNNLMKNKTTKSIPILGGVKEEQVLDAFKILFNDTQVNWLLKFYIIYLISEHIG